MYITFHRNFWRGKVQPNDGTGVVNVPLNRRKDVEVCMNGIGDCLNTNDEFNSIQIKNFVGLILVNYLRLKRAATFAVPSGFKGRR